MGRFQLGTELATVAKQTGVSPAQIKVIHRRPVLIQELEWRSEARAAFRSRRGTWFSVSTMVSSFEWWSIRRPRNGRTHGRRHGGGDLRTYGVATHTTPSAKASAGRYSDEEQVLAQWHDAKHHFDLIRSSYGGRYSLAGVLKRLEEPAAKAIAEAARLDNNEAPQREIDRIAAQAESDRVNLDKARVANKPKFRP